MKVLVTGATGFIGGALVRRLVSQGHAVRALVRPRHKRSTLAARGIAPVVGDLLDRASLAAAVAGVDGIFHVAASYTFWARDPAEIYDTNVRGTVSLLEAARSAGVRRFVFTSSVGTLKAPPEGELADEASVAQLSDIPDDYHRSKLLAEQSALAANGHGFEVVVVNPTVPVGPGDVRPTPTGRIVLEFLRRRTPGYVEGRLNLVGVEDVASGHLAAFERGRAGRRYLLGGENTTLSGVYGMLARATGLRRRPIRVPYWLATLTARIDGLIEGRLLRREPFVPLDGLRALRKPMHVDCSRAARELGYRPGPVVDALARAARWFEANGYVRVAGARRKPTPEAPH